jgi:hypothetical protein
MLYSDNNAEIACQLQPLGAGRDTHARNIEHIAGEEEEDSTLTAATVSGCPDQEGDRQFTACVVIALASFSHFITSAKMFCPKLST